MKLLLAFVIQWPRHPSLKSFSPFSTRRTVKSCLGITVGKRSASMTRTLSVLTSFLGELLSASRQQVWPHVDAEPTDGSLSVSTILTCPCVLPQYSRLHRFFLKGIFATPSSQVFSGSSTCTASRKFTSEPSLAPTINPSSLGTTPPPCTA